MSDPLLPGKLQPQLLRELLAPRTSLPKEVVLGPAVGEDACAIDLPAGVLVAATDPITLTGSAVGAHAVVINANDVAVMGVSPRWFLATVLLPPGTAAVDVRALFDTMRDALEEVGATLVGGHTEVTPAVTAPIVIGQMLGHRPDGRVLRTGDVRPGDVIVQVGPAPIEAAAILADGSDARLKALNPDLLERARNALADPGISVVQSALRAADLGARALHDPTESGLSAGLHELAEASQIRIELDDDAIPWFEPGVAVCRALGANPWGALASGALLAAFPADRADDACRALETPGRPARVIGRAVEGEGVILSDGSPLATFARDEVARLSTPDPSAASD